MSYLPAGSPLDLPFCWLAPWGGGGGGGGSIVSTSRGARSDQNRESYLSADRQDSNVR
jgi:hypothetical protein